MSDVKRLRKLWIFRHGETDWNAAGRFQGHTDIPLNDRGREQARGLVPVLRAQGLEALVSSDLSRAVETARIIARELSLPVHTDVGLREAFLGDAQGMTYQEILERFGDDVAGRWRSDHPTDADVCYPGGETGAQVTRRVFEALQRFMGAHPYRRFGVSTHGGVIRRIMQALRPPGREPAPIPNAVLYQLAFDPAHGKWHLHPEDSL